MKKTLTLITLLLILTTQTHAYRLRPYKKKPTPQEAAVKFVNLLAKSEFKDAWNMLTEHSKKVIARLTIQRYEDLDEKIYTVDEMMYMLHTNSGGHRTVMFEDLRKYWCRKNGIPQSALSNVKAKKIKAGNSEALVRLDFNGKKVDLIMKNKQKFTPKWEAAWFPAKLGEKFWKGIN